MKKNALLLLLLTALLSAGFFIQSEKKTMDDHRFVTYTVNPKKQEVVFYLKNKKRENFKNAANLKLWLDHQNKELLFATNGGMYTKEHTPQGLYIENQMLKNPIDKATGEGNFYLQPNGVFYITSTKNPVICTSENFPADHPEKVAYATQSGPMLVIRGVIHQAFKENSANLNIRNGVGILPNNEIVFVQSKKEISFYDLAAYFKGLGCKNALYLDGFVSRTYLPEKKWVQTDGDFGVIIAVTKPKHK